MTPPTAVTVEASAPPSLGAVAQAFLVLGLAGFGGPAAHIGLMEESLVRRRGWVRREDFLAQWATVQLLPGPTSTELALVLGRQLAGWPGFWMAAIGFIGPAVLLTWGLAVGWQTLGASGGAELVRRGVAPAAAALLLATTWRLGQPLRAVRWQLAIAVGTAVASVAWDLANPLGDVSPTGIGTVLLTVAGGLASPPSVPGLFWLFLGIGATIVGSGYSLVGWLGALAVTWLGWLTDAQLLDAIAAGQMTPGPLFATATFVGQIIAGPWGAAAATAGIFLPALAYATGAVPLSRWLDKAPWRRVLRDGVAAGSVGLIGAAAWTFIPLLHTASLAVMAGGVALLMWGKAPAPVSFVAIGVMGALVG